jgi:4-hydroxy 2-oxovalerate aldolase
MKKKLLVLDCTLRDGGLALEDAYLNGDRCRVFNKKITKNYINIIKNSKIDIIEIGSIEKSKKNKTQFSIYQNIQQVSKFIPLQKNSGQMYVALYRGPDTPYNEIPEWNNSLCEGVRVIIRYSEMEKSLDFCHMLSDKGYKVFVQPMVTMRYTDKEIKFLINRSNSFNAYALYIVDSYGYMTPFDILNLYKKFDHKLLRQIRIGFHSHNNMNLAFSNVQAFINQKTNRSLIIDSTIMGMGQGAGNIQTELLISYLNSSKNIQAKYDFNYVLDSCEIIEKYLTENLWGYSVKNLLSAINKTAYKFSSRLRKHYKMSYSQINNFLTNMPKKLKQRYSDENLLQVIKKYHK